MIGTCKGCDGEKYVTEYIYVDASNESTNHGMYCSECMTCSMCGTILTPSKLAYMKQSVGGMELKAEEWDVQP